MAEILIFLCGALAGAGLCLVFKGEKAKREERQKYDKYKRTTGLYEGVRRK